MGICLGKLKRERFSLDRKRRKVLEELCVGYLGLIRKKGRVLVK